MRLKTIHKGERGPLLLESDYRLILRLMPYAMSGPCNFKLAMRMFDFCYVFTAALEKDNSILILPYISYHRATTNTVRRRVLRWSCRSNL